MSSSPWGVGPAGKVCLGKWVFLLFLPHPATSVSLARIPIYPPSAILPAFGCVSVCPPALLLTELQWLPGGRTCPRLALDLDPV